MALPARRNPAEVARSDPFAELNRSNQQLASHLERWDDLPSLAEGFTPRADLEKPTTPTWSRSNCRGSSAMTFRSRCPSVA